MNGIYLTQEGKQRIEAKIYELEKEYFKLKGNDDADEHYFDGARTYLKEMLSSATILPSEESWAKIIFNGKYQIGAKEKYPHGIIIQPKK